MRLKCRDLYFKAKYKWPWMSKKKHRKLIDEHGRLTRQDALAIANREIAEVRGIMSGVVPKLVAVSIDRSFSADRYRLVLDLDPFMIRQAFEFGNDNKAMGYFCEAVGQ